MGLEGGKLKDEWIEYGAIEYKFMIRERKIGIGATLEDVEH